MSLRIGEIAEMRFKLMALELNIPTFEPVIDLYGVDFITLKNKNPIKLQVKSTLRADEKRKYSYRINVNHGFNGKAYAVDTFDYLVVYLFDIATWYIIPLSVVNATTIRINPNSEKCKYISYKEKWSLLI